MAAPMAQGPKASTPPMGWNDWAHYECNYTADTILANARTLVSSGLAAHGYNTVTIDDCWMQKTRDGKGDLQVDPQRFPHGMKAVADAVQAMGLKFGIYEDAGYLTCGRFAGSGEPDGGGADHFAQDAKLFASWGVSYLKLDGCNVYAPGAAGSNPDEHPSELAYRSAYARQSAVLASMAKAGHPIIFSESAPAYFQGSPDWYTVLSWVRGYGQLWREGDDIDVFNPKKPDTSRFPSILWNYAYNLPLGRFQSPGNWNDADFIIGGDRGVSLAETHSQIALWSMMSAPLILSSNLAELSPASLTVLRNSAVLAVDQDALGREATLVRRSPQLDVLLKPLHDGDYAVAVLNHGSVSASVSISPADLGFTSSSSCAFQTRDLWTGKTDLTGTLKADVATHDTLLWQLHPATSCGKPKRTGTITMIGDGKKHDIPSYTRCLAASAPDQTTRVQSCSGAQSEAWTITSSGNVESGKQCLAQVSGRAVLQTCGSTPVQHWTYTLAGNLKSMGGLCLTSEPWSAQPVGVSLQGCGNNLPSQIWSLPNALPHQ
jgi:alpha-galactosidase